MSKVSLKKVINVDRAQTIVDEFLSTAEKFPVNKAASDETGSITYAELNAVSDIVARKILEVVGGRPQSSSESYVNIGVLFPRKKEVLAAFMGVLKSGCSYVYASPDIPSDRFDFIMQDAEVACIVTTKEAADAFKGCEKYPLIFIEDILAECENDEGTEIEHINFSEMDKPAFLTYTSGSTGTPKGVVNTFHYIKNHNDARHFFYEPKPNECIGNIVSFSYAASTYDLFSGLTVGCNLYIFSNEELLNQQLTIKRVIDNNIATVFMIPNMISVVFAPGVDLPIKYVITAGEKAKQIPNISAEIAEIYGSSEAAAVIGRIAKPGDDWNLLGEALPGNTLFLVDEAGNQITDCNLPGELCVVNDALALEYRNRPDDTQSKFTDCPYVSGKRMYKTGDLMQLGEDGKFYYCGRKDNMTKINGQRVEMGEIESNIVEIDGVEDAVCTIVNKNGADMLVCYYVPDSEKPPVSVEDLIAHTSSKLPRYMVPLYWVPLDAFPRNVNGKVDRRALPEPDFMSFVENEEPESEIEEQLLQVAKKLLPDINFGVTDDLMKLGMDSILAVQFVTEIEKFKPEITVSEVMRHKTIRKILTAKKQVSWFYESYDANKKVIVLISGIIPVSGLSQICEAWSKHFNILLIEPFLDHINTECENYDYDILVDFYMQEVSAKIDDKKAIFAFAGFSFGGQLAISVAAKWAEKFDEIKHVFMGDTLIQLMYPGKVLPVLTEDDPYIQMVMKNSKKYGDTVIKEPIEQVIDKQNAVIDLMRTIKVNQKYDGPVLYMDAHLDYDAVTQQVKIGAVKSLYENIEILEFPQNFHNDLYMESSFVKNYDEILPKWIDGVYDK